MILWVLATIGLVTFAAGISQLIYAANLDDCVKSNANRLPALYATATFMVIIGAGMMIGSCTKGCDYTTADGVHHNVC